MRTLWYYVRIYFLIASQHIKTKLQYRGDFVLGVLGMLGARFGVIFSYWAIFDSIDTLAGWTFDEMLFITGFYTLSMFPLQFFFDQIWELDLHCLLGTFIKYYLRPMNMMFYFMTDKVDLKSLGQLSLGLVTLLIASSRLQLVWTPSLLLTFLALYAGASLITISIVLLGGMAAFWSNRAWGVIDLASRLREFAPYPVSAFGRVMRLVFTYLMPIGFIAFYPSQFFLRPERTAAVYLSPAVGVLSFALAYFVWKKGVNHYAGTGT